MRSTVLVVAGVVLLGCSDSHDDAVHVCVEDSNCNLVAGSKCTAACSGTRYCAVPTPAAECASRFRWTNNPGSIAGEGLAGLCVVPEDTCEADAGVDLADGGVNDGGIDAISPDASILDASIDGPPGTWSAPSELLNTIGIAERDATISSDGLTLMYSRTTATSGRDIYIATRLSSTVPFGTPVPFAAVNTSQDETNPHMSANRLELYFSRAPSGSFADCHVSTRATKATSWNTAIKLDWGVSPEGCKSSSLSSDGLTIYYLRATTGDGTAKFRTRASIGAAWGAEQEVTLTGAPAYYFHLDVSSDGLRILLSSRQSDGVPWLAVGSRASTGDAFGNFQPIDITPVRDLFAAEWNADETEIYYDGQNMASTGYGIWVSALQ